MGAATLAILYSNPLHRFLMLQLLYAFYLSRCYVHIRLEIEHISLNVTLRPPAQRPLLRAISLSR